MSSQHDVPEITPLELRERLDAGKVPVMVDVRELREAAIADLPEHGQLRIPTGEFFSRIDEIPEGEVVLYCRSGGRSAWAAALLMQSGRRDVLNLKGGVLGWRNDVDPSLRAY